MIKIVNVTKAFGKKYECSHTFFCYAQKKVCKEKGVCPAKKHPVSVAGGAHPCAPGFSLILSALNLVVS